MREIHYIDIDEEIISAVSRLRNSGQGENVFIFPKRALILQSIVNLRLLEREAKKLGKQIIVVSQDEAGRKLAEKAGLMVEEYQDQTLQGAPAKETTRFMVEATEEGVTIPLPEKNAVKEGRQRSTEIGSESFFSTGITPAIAPLSIHASQSTPHERETRAVLPSAIEPPKKLRVRNMTPHQGPSLNSNRMDTLPSGGVVPPLMPLPKPPLPTSDGIAPRSTAMSPASRTPLPEPVPLPPPPSLSSPQSSREGRLSRFMGAKSSPSQTVTTSPAPAQNWKSTPPLATSPYIKSSQRKTFNWAWVMLGGIVLVGGIGLGLYVLFPKAIITVQPQTAEQVIRFQTTVVTDGTAGENMVHGRIATLERSVQLTEEATGTSNSDSAKARGKIKIYNDFSKEAQSLVATTRFETKEGKIFRLLEGVTVPGVNESNGKRERGMVEATVVADQPGADYNVAPTIFTIPGFKGGPKYDKFTAESSQTFTGGGSGGASSGQKIVSGDDLNRAKMKALEEAKKAVLEELRSSLKSGEVILEDSMLLTERPGASSPATGTPQANFTYETRFETKTFIIDEKIVKDRIEKERVTTSGVTLLPHEYDVRYTALLPKYEAGRLDMTVESTVKFQADLSEEKVKGALLGQDEAGIRGFLEKHPEIERLQVEFHPQLIVSTIPTQANRVTVELIASKEEEH